MLKRILFMLTVTFVSAAAFSQVTTSNLSCLVKSTSGESIVGASVKVTHNPTGTVYSGITRTGGRFDLANISPGGPYTVEITFTGLEKSVRENIFLSLGETSQQEFVLSAKATELKEVIVAASRRSIQEAKGGAETTIGRDKMANLPTVGRNISDYLRYVPQAKITGDGGVSLAGQNNRYNSFYIDGAVNNDVFGLAASGTNGGQAGIAPISIDAIDQFQVVLSPYDASLGNFTGGGINATTRSGTNQYQGSIYYFFRNQGLSGKTPGVDKSIATKLPDFTNKTIGFRVGGPIIKNKLFFFLNGEIQRDERPQPFSGQYAGASSLSEIDALANFLRTTYGYDPGGYLDNPEKVEADRIAAKIDWRINNANKLTAS
ncbi:MAG TPA: carboxypeptidase regulatory-like domain-containing protein, partial [Chitinophagaceae bacterium]|nr:carboxypeptidase regulatory-like domain-containing protein [Chitinophagaceae bacterium]